MLGLDGNSPRVPLGRCVALGLGPDLALDHGLHVWRDAGADLALPRPAQRIQREIGAIHINMITVHM